MGALGEFKAQDAGLDCSNPQKAAATNLCAILRLSHCTRVLESWKNKAKKSRLPKKVERKVAGSSLHEDVNFFCLYSMLKLTCHVPILDCWRLINFMLQIKLIGKCSGHFHFGSIGLVKKECYLRAMQPPPIIRRLFN